MEYILIRQSLFIRINHSDELNVWRIKRSQLYMYFYLFQELRRGRSMRWVQRMQRRSWVWWSIKWTRIMTSTYQGKNYTNGSNSLLSQYLIFQIKCSIWNFAHSWIFSVSKVESVICLALVACFLEKRASSDYPRLYPTAAWPPDRLSLCTFKNSKFCSAYSKSGGNTAINLMDNRGSHNTGKVNELTNFRQL